MGDERRQTCTTEIHFSFDETKHGVLHFIKAGTGFLFLFFVFVFVLHHTSSTIQHNTHKMRRTLGRLPASLSLHRAPVLLINHLTDDAINLVNQSSPDHSNQPRSPSLLSQITLSHSWGTNKRFNYPRHIHSVGQETTPNIYCRKLGLPVKIYSTTTLLVGPRTLGGIHGLSLYPVRISLALNMYPRLGTPGAYMKAAPFHGAFHIM